MEGNLTLNRVSGACGCGLDGNRIREVSGASYRALAIPGSPALAWIEEVEAIGDGAAFFDVQQQLCVSNDGWRTPASAVGDRNRRRCPLHRMHYLSTWLGHDASGCPAARAVETGQPLELAVCLPRPDRRVCPKRVRFVPVSDATGRVVGVAVREFESPEFESTQSTQTGPVPGRLDVLVGGIAHDFNNLLVGILGFSSLAEDVLDDPHPAKPYVRGIRQSAEQAARLTRELLCYAQGSSPETEVLAFKEIIEESLELLATRLHGGIRVHRQLDEGLRPLRADPAQIRQVVLNICLNAVQAMSEHGGDLWVSTGETLSESWTRTPGTSSGGLAPGRYVRFTVRDSGKGIEGSTLSRIFEPYVTTHRLGRGLGLPAVAGAVREHAGAIRVESQPGRGTRFDVFLPACEGRVEVKDSTQRPVLPRGHETILILDDEDRVRRMLSGALDRLGYRCLEATNAVEAVSMFSEQHDQIDLVVLDMVMPDATGEEVFQSLRRIDPKVKCVLSSGYSRSMSLDRQTCDHLAGFLQKPYHLHTLAQRIREALDRKPT